MHVGALLHKKLKDASIHASRLKVLMETSKSLLNHSKLTLTGLARGLKSKANTKSNINKMVKCPRCPDQKIKKVSESAEKQGFKK